MPHLLVATDFSATGNGAVHYACRLAMDLQLEVTVLHAYILPVTFSDNPLPLVPVQDLQQLSATHLDRLVTELQAAYPGLAIGEELAYGDILDCLQEAAGKRQPALVILGNNGTGNSDLWLGSTAVDILRHLRVPALAIPAGTEYRSIGNICLACDFPDVDEEMPVAPLKEWLQRTGARLHVLHVSRESAATPGPAFEETILPRLLAGCPVSYHYTAAGGVDEGIAGFAATQHMDWLALIPHHHRFWEGLFHRSHTKAMARMSSVPILALHPKEKQ